MPKKFQGENSKAAEARARNNKVVEDERLRKEKTAEDKLWEDNDKHILKKQERQDEKEKKAQEVLLKKQERDKLLEEEMNSIKGAKSSVLPAKVTRAHIDVALEREKAVKIAAKAKADNATPLGLDVEEQEAPIHENVNRLVAEEGSARNVEDALAVLSTKDDESGDKHPEKRVRAAYVTYEERELPRLKEEYPNFRLSQLKQMLKKEWQKSPDNPFNQTTQAYNSERR